MRDTLQILQIETDGAGFYALVANITGDGEYKGHSVVELSELGGGLIQGLYRINGYTTTSKEKLLDRFKSLLIYNVDATLSTDYFLIGKVGKGFLVLDSDKQERIVSDDDAKALTYFNAFFNGERFALKCGSPLGFCTLHASIEKKLEEYMEFYKFTAKPGIVGRVSMSNTFSNELTRCKIVGQTNGPLRIYTVPRYVKSIGKNGLELSGAWCELRFKPNQTIRYNSIKMERTTIQKLEMTSEQVCDSRLSFLENGQVILSDLCLLDIPTKEQLFTILDIVAEQGRYINLEGYISPDCIPETLGKRIIKSVSLKCPKKKTDYTREIYAYSRSLAKMYVQEFSQLLHDCFGQRGFTPSNEVVECTRYCIDLLTKNLEVFATIADIMQPLCSEDLTCSETHSIYQLMDTLRDKMKGIIQDYISS